MANYSFFQKEFEFVGRHAEMVDELWVQNDYGKTYFRRLVDLYRLAPIIGFRMNRKAEIDKSGTMKKSIFLDQLRGESENLMYVLQMILVLEANESMTAAESVKIALKPVETEEEFNKHNKLFHDYVRGGVEELYERLVVKKMDLDHPFCDEKTANIMELIHRFR